MLQDDRNDLYIFNQNRDNRYGKTHFVLRFLVKLCLKPANRLRYMETDQMYKRVIILTKRSHVAMCLWSMRYVDDVKWGTKKES